MLLFGCQYQCNRLLGKTRPRNDLLCVEWDVKPYTLTQSLTYFVASEANVIHQLGLLERRGLCPRRTPCPVGKWRANSSRIQWQTKWQMSVHVVQLPGLWAAWRRQLWGTGIRCPSTSNSQFLGRVALVKGGAGYSRQTFSWTICRSVCLSCALWKNGGSDPDAILTSLTN